MGQFTIPGMTRKTPISGKMKMKSRLTIDRIGSSVLLVLHQQPTRPKESSPKPQPNATPPPTQEQHSASKGRRISQRTYVGATSSRHAQAQLTQGEAESTTHQPLSHGGYDECLVTGSPPPGSPPPDVYLWREGEL